jgi:hypothetical protein
VERVDGPIVCSDLPEANGVIELRHGSRQGGIVSHGRGLSLFR